MPSTPIPASPSRSRQLFAAIAKWWSNNRSKIYFRAKKIFHFKKTGGWVIGLCWGIGWTVALGTGFPPIPKQLFYLAYALFFFGFVWWLGSFLTSEHLNKLNPRSWPSRRKKNKKQFASAFLKYRLYSWAVSLALIGLFCFSWWVTYAVQSSRELSEMNGILIPASDPDPPNPCPIPFPENALAIYYGDSVAFFLREHQSVISITKPRLLFGPDIRKEILGIERKADGSILLNADIRSDDGKIIALISRNQFEVNENNIVRSLFKRPDRSTIRLTDQYANNFEIRYLNRHALRVSGRFALGPRSAVDIKADGSTTVPGGNTFSRSCSGDSRSVFDFEIR